MKLKAYSVRDGAVEAYLPPFFARSDGEAKRSFIQACKTGSMKNMEVYYALFHIGYYDDNTGELTSTSQPSRLMTGLETITTNEANILHTAIPRDLKKIQEDMNDAKT